MRRNRKERVIALVLSILMVFSMMPASLFASTDSISTETANQVVKNAEELLKADFSKGQTVELGADIVLSEGQQIAKVEGVLDGKGHTITIGNKPLVAEVTGTIQNLITDGNLSPSLDYQGGLVTFLNGGTIVNSASNINFTIGFLSCDGGIAGRSENGKIYNSYYSGNVSLGTMAEFAGIIGQSNNSDSPSEIKNCYFTGDKDKPVNFGNGYNQNDPTNAKKSSDELKSSSVVELLNNDIKDTGFVWAAVEGDFPKLVENKKGITTAEELISADFSKGKTVELAADIVLSEGQQIAKVEGVLDGKGHTITLADKPLTAEITGTVQNLGVTGKLKNSDSYQGSISTNLNGGTILNCFSTVDFDLGFNADGGLVGNSSDGKIYNSYFAGTGTEAFGMVDLGAIIGASNNLGHKSVIKDCYYTAGKTKPVNVGTEYNSGEEGKSYAKKTVEEMKSAEVVQLLNNNIQDTGFVWKAVPGEFPALAEKSEASGPDTDVVDKSRLEAKIEEASKLLKTDYTEETWGKFETALNNAKTAVKSNDQKKINDALTSLTEAMNGLKKPMPVSAVKAPAEDQIIYITKVDDLEKIGTGKGKYYRLKNDITIKSNDFYFVFDAFEGVFDGNGKTITLEGSNKLFKSVAPSGVVQNTHFAGTNLSGAPVTDTLYGALINCSSSVSGKEATGLVKRISGDGVISNCVAYGKAGSGAVLYKYGGDNYETEENLTYTGKIYNTYWLKGGNDPSITDKDLLEGSSVVSEDVMQSKTIVNKLNAKKGTYGIAWGQNGVTGMPYFGVDQEYVPEEEGKLPENEKYKVKFAVSGETIDVTKSQLLEVSPDEVLAGNNILGNFSLEGVPETSSIEWNVVSENPEGNIAINRRNGALHIYGEGEAVIKATERNKEGVVSDVAHVKVVSKAKAIEEIKLFINGTDVTGLNHTIQGSEWTSIEVKAKFVGEEGYRTINPSRFTYVADDQEMVHNVTTSREFKFNKPGTSRIEVSYEGDKSKKAFVNITSVYVPVTSVEQSIPSKVVLHGLNLLSEAGRAYLEQKDGITIKPANASNQNNWEITSSNPEVATYIKYLVYGYVPYKMGTTTFTATVIDKAPDGKINRVSSSKEVTFEYLNPLTAITTPDDIKMKSGDEIPVEGLEFTGERSGEGYHVSDALMDWSYDKEGIVKVYRKGDGYNSRQPGFEDLVFVDNDKYLIKGIKPGRVKVTGTPVDTKNGVKPVTFNVEVTQGEVKPVDIAPLIKKGKEGGLEYLLNSPTDNLGYNDEWLIFTLERIGKPVSDKDKETYLKNLAKEVATWKADQKPTDIERVILAVNAIGADPTDIGGKDLIKMVYNHKGLMDGSNEMAFALLAVDSKNSEIPSNAMWSRDEMIKGLIEFQNKDGGFALFPKSDSGIDTTAMSIQGLAPYMDREDVKASVEKGLEYLKNKLDPSYGYGTSEAISQTIIALSAIGKDASGKDNPDFGDVSANLITSLMSFYSEDPKGFKHQVSLDTNKMATLQAVEAIDAYERFLKGKTRYYDLTDMHVVGTADYDVQIEGETGKLAIDNTLTDNLMNLIKDNKAERLNINVNKGLGELKKLDIELSKEFLKKISELQGDMVVTIHGAEMDLQLDKAAIAELLSKAGDKTTLTMEKISDTEFKATFNNDESDTFESENVKVTLPVKPGNEYPEVKVNGVLTAGKFAGAKVTVNVKKIGLFSVTEDTVTKDAEEVIDLIDSIGRAVSINSGEKIDAARKAYNALSEASKAKVTNIDKLLKAEKTYASIKKEAERPVSKVEVNKTTGKTTVTSDSLTAVVKPETIKNAKGEIEFILNGVSVTYDRKAVEEISRYINENDINVVLDVNKSGSEYTATLTVNKMDGRKVVINNLNDGTVSIKAIHSGSSAGNSDKNSNKSEGTSPKTGDSDNMIFFIMLLMGALTALTAVKKRENLK